MRRIGVTLLVLALLVGSAAAFALTEALKLDGRTIAKARATATFAPDGSCGLRKAWFALKLRRSDAIDAVVVDADGRPVRTLASRTMRRSRWIKLTWNGLRDDGSRARDGEYRLRVLLHRQDRTVTIPKAVRLTSARPSAEDCPGRKRA